MRRALVLLVTIALLPLTASVAMADDPPPPPTGG